MKDWAVTPGLFVFRISMVIVGKSALSMPRGWDGGAEIERDGEVVSVALTERQKRFVEEYLVDMNATQAAIRAEYSKKTAEQMGYQLLQKTSVQRAIQEARAKQQERTQITADAVLKEYAKIAFFDPRKLFQDNGQPKDITMLDDDTAGALAGLDVMEEYEGHGQDREFVGYTKKYKIADKLRALDALGKHLGVFDGKGGQTDGRENNLLDAIRQSGEEIDTDDLPEVQ